MVTFVRMRCWGFALGHKSLADVTTKDLLVLMLWWRWVSDFMIVGVEAY